MQKQTKGDSHFSNRAFILNCNSLAILLQYSLGHYRIQNIMPLFRPKPAELFPSHRTIPAPHDVPGLPTSSSEPSSGAGAAPHRVLGEKTKLGGGEVVPEVARPVTADSGLGADLWHQLRLTKPSSVGARPPRGWAGVAGIALLSTLALVLQRPSSFCLHTRPRTHTHLCAHVCAHARMHTDAQRPTRTRVHTRVAYAPCTCTRAHTDTYTPPCTHAHVHRHMHAAVRTHTRHV